MQTDKMIGMWDVRSNQGNWSVMFKEAKDWIVVGQPPPGTKLDAVLEYIYSHAHATDIISVNGSFHTIKRALA